MAETVLDSEVIGSQSGKVPAATKWRGKVMAAVVYPEALAAAGMDIQDVIQYITDTEPKRWYAILHDKDVFTAKDERQYKQQWEQEHGGKPLLPQDVAAWEAHKAGRVKKAHYHIVWEYARPRAVQPFQDWLASFRIGLCQGKVSFRRMARYLTHMDSKYGYKYPVSDVMGYADRYLQDCEPPLDQQVLSELFYSAIFTDGVTEFAALAQIAHANGWQYTAHLMARATYYHYILASKRNGKKSGGVPKGVSSQQAQPRQVSPVAQSLTEQALADSPAPAPAASAPAVVLAPAPAAQPAQQPATSGASGSSSGAPPSTYTAVMAINARDVAAKRAYVQAGGNPYDFTPPSAATVPAPSVSYVPPTRHPDKDNPDYGVMQLHHL